VKRTGIYDLMSINSPRRGHHVQLSTMDEYTFYAVITLFLICLISGVICIFFLFKFSQTTLWHVQMLLFAIVIISGAVSLSSLVIALREVRNYHLDVS
jgi:hypothetical protein